MRTCCASFRYWGISFSGSGTMIRCQGANGNLLYSTRSDASRHWPCHKISGRKNALLKLKPPASNAFSIDSTFSADARAGRSARSGLKFSSHTPAVRVRQTSSESMPISHNAENTARSSSVAFSSPARKRCTMRLNVALRSARKDCRRLSSCRLFASTRMNAPT